MTKVIGVARAIDGTMGPQQILRDLYNQPELLQDIYLKGLYVYVKIADRTYLLGAINEKYRTDIQNNFCKVVRWQITGGQPMPDSTRLMHLGLNITINLLKKYENQSNPDQIVLFRERH